MSDLAVKVENISKKFNIGLQKTGSFRESVSHRWRSLFSKNDIADAKAFWALQDISFEAKKGEAIGIVGRNGAGKSTLLKILSRIVEPTHGRFEINGRVSSLLEVGTGFHPELTGRENVFLNGTILGMRRKEVKAKFDEIVAFSGIEKFIDTPVKRYSSGMKVRLAFAVAAHLEPEILIIDEVLAVGDAEFQKKCLGKMNEVSKEGGRTVLFVSHNMTAVQALCSKGIYLKNGQVALSGSSQEVVVSYLQEQTTATSLQKKWEAGLGIPGELLLNSLTILPSSEQTSWYTLDDSIAIELDYQLSNLKDTYDFTLQVFTEEGIHVFSTSSIFNGGLKQEHTGNYKAHCSIPSHFLNDKRYTVSVLIVKNKGQVLAKAEEVVSFELVDEGIDRQGWKGKVGGVIRPTLPWVVEAHENIFD